MAAAGRRADRSLSERLRAEPYRYGFFQAVRLMHALEPTRAKIGFDHSPGDEVVRFQAEQSLLFPASEILDIGESANGEPPGMVVRFMGLTGPVSPLPRHYTELIVNRLRKKDRTLPAFFDWFNHRMVSLFFRSWEKYRLWTRFDADAKDDLATYLFSFFGLGTRGLRRRLAVRDNALLFYTGLLAQRPHSATALESILADYFGDVPVATQQFMGQWLWLDPESLTQLERFGYNNQLGADAVLGRRVWHTQSRFRVRFGPIGYKRFCEFLPCGPASLPALELTRFFVGQEYDFEFQLTVLAAEVPFCELGSTGPEANRLGWSTWLKSREFTRDAGDAVFDAEKLRAYHARGTEEWA